jgi:hypothetical protein
MEGPNGAQRWAGRGTARGDGGRERTRCKRPPS